MKLTDETATPDPEYSTAQSLIAEYYFLTAQASDNRTLVREWTIVILISEEHPLTGKGGDGISK